MIERLKDVEEKARQTLPKGIVTLIDEYMKNEYPKSYLIAVLHEVQAHFGYLPEEMLTAVSYLMEVPTSTVSGVATFYHFFRMEKTGKHIVSICMGTACHVKGSDKVIKKLSEKFNVSPGETTKDENFTVEATRCMGMCAMAAVAKVDEEFLSHVTPDELIDMLEKLESEKRDQENK